MDTYVCVCVHTCAVICFHILYIYVIACLPTKRSQVHTCVCLCVCVGPGHEAKGQIHTHSTHAVEWSYKQKDRELVSISIIHLIIILINHCSIFQLLQYKKFFKATAIHVNCFTHVTLPLPALAVVIDLTLPLDVIFLDTQIVSPLNPVHTKTGFTRVWNGFQASTLHPVSSQRVPPGFT